MRAVRRDRLSGLIRAGALGLTEVDTNSRVVAEHLEPDRPGQ